MNETEVVHHAIWDQVPELREALIAFEQEWVESDLELGVEPFIGPHNLISAVLTQPYLFPLLDDSNRNDEALRNCAEAIEQMLGTPSESLNNAVGVRIVDRLLLPPERWRKFRQHAGPMLKEEVLKSSEYFPWPYDEPVA